MPSAQPMAVADAQMYWMSAKVPNDQFLLYAFDGAPADLDGAIAELVGRARSCPQLRLRVAEPGWPRYPAWVAGDVGAGQVVVHAGGCDWSGCLDAVTRLADDQLDLRRMPWRLHVFSGIHDIPSPAAVPGSTRPGTVAVMQIGHALADGSRSAMLAGVLFGRADKLDPIKPIPQRGLLRRGFAAARAHRELGHDTAIGRVPPPAPPRPVLSTNSRPAGVRMLRTIVRAKRELACPTVTVGVLSAISTALSGYLTARGEDAALLGAEVPMRKEGVPRAHNHFRNVGVGLFPAVTPEDRARRISADLDDRRRRGSHAAFTHSDRATAALPAPLLRWGIKQFDTDARSTLVIGNTVVSSINRGPADLTFGGCPVILTAGYPALSPMMGLTHGVHGIGDAVAISVHTAESVMPDVDEYMDRLDAALRA